MGIISGETCILGLLGDPVKHSLSPAMHNAALEEMSLNWCYIPMPCKTKHLEIVLKSLHAINCQGLNITIPHKETIFNLCSSVTPIAKRLKAVNTLLPNQNGGWTGTNTDVEGFLSPIKDSKWQEKKALVIMNFSLTI